MASSTFSDLAEGTVYPALTRLEAAGHLESYLQRSASGPARKYYRITKPGRAELTRLHDDWATLTTLVADLTDNLTNPVGTSAATDGRSPGHEEFR